MPQVACLLSMPPCSPYHAALITFTCPLTWIGHLNKKVLAVEEIALAVAGQHAGQGGGLVQLHAH